MRRRSHGATPQLSRKRVLLIAGILLVVATFGISAVGRAIFAPWSIGLFGRDTLTGSWVGSLEARQGAEYGLYLDLDYKGRSTSYRGSGSIGKSTNLKGHATLCTPTGERYDYEVSGHASPFGTVEDLWLEYGDPSLSALNLRLTGKWRAPELSLETYTNPFLPDGRFVPTRSLSSDDPDDSILPFTLVKGDREAFEATCQQVGG